MKLFYALVLLLFLFSAQAQTTFTVGPGQQYNSITAAYAAIPNNFTGAYIISLQQGYSALNETFPIAFTAKSGSSATNTITVRPAVSGLLIASADTSGTFEFNGSSYVTIDGRVNGTGSVADLTVINSNTNGSACMFLPGSNYNKLTYTNAQGVNSAVIFNGQYATAAATGNQISNCNISGLGGAFCNYGINNLGNLCTWHNTKTLYNNIFNFNTNGVAYGGLFDNSVIQGNSFYITQAHAVLNGWSAIYVGGTQINFAVVNSANIQVQGNFIGGNAPQCAGLLYCDVRQAQMVVVDVSHTVPSYVDSNIITNISTYDTVTNTPYGSFYLMTLGGIVYAGSRYGNQIGDTVSTGAIQVSSNGAKTFMMFYFEDYGYVLLENTLAGSISVGGGMNGLYYAYNNQQLTAHATLRNNFFGSSVNRSSINQTGNLLPFYLYYSYKVDTVDNNVFSGLTVGGGNLYFLGIDSGKAVTGNTIKNITMQPAAGNISNLTPGWFINALAVSANHISSVYANNISEFYIIESSNVLNNTVDSFYLTSKSSNLLVRGIQDPTASQGLHTLSHNRFTNLILIDSSGTLDFSAIISYSATAIDSNTVTGVVVPYAFKVAGITFGGLASTQILGNTFSHFNGAGMYGVFINTNGQGSAQQTVLINNNTIADITGGGASSFYIESINNLVINNNTITRITGFATPIYVNGVNYTYCSGNVIKDIRTVSTQAGLTQLQLAVINIYGTADTIINNVIDNVSVKAVAGCAVSLGGLQYYAGQNANLVHNNAFTHLWIDSGSVKSVLYGIYATTPAYINCYNNLVQLGVKNDGTISTLNCTRYGIYVPNTTNQLQYSFYYNTVYLAGNVVNGSNNSFAFYSGNLNNSIYNNIFLNEVSTPGGTGKNISIALPGYLNQAVDFNIYHAGGTNGAIASIDTGLAAINTLAAFKTAILGQNLNAMDTDALLINTTGDTAAINLGPTSSSPAIANATTYSIPATYDYYNFTRSATAPTIGAIERAGLQVPVIDSVVNVACSSNATGAITFNLPNGVVWTTVQVLNSSNVVVQTFSNVTGTQTAGQLAAGTYTLKFTNPTAGTVTLTATVQSIATAPAAPTVTKQTICAGATAVLTATNGSSYQWYDSLSNGNLLSSLATLNTSALNTTHVYYVQSNPAGCPSPRSADTVVVINLQSPVLTSTAPEVCYGQSITLNGTTGSGTINWYSQAGGGTALATGNSYTLTAGTTQTFYANVKQGNCSSATDSITIHIDSLPAAPVLTTTNTTVCPGKTDTLSVQNTGLTYSWYTTATGGNAVATGATYITPAINSAANYYAAAYDGHCYSARQTETITLLTAPVAVVQPFPFNVCPGNAATFTVSNNNGVVSWYNNTQLTTPVATGGTYTTPVVYNSTAYYVTIQYPNGCISVAVADSVIVHAQVAPVITLSGLTLTSNQPAGNQWYFNDSIISGATAVTYTAAATGNYFVVTTNGYGCADTSATQFVLVNGIAQIDASAVNIYPSPNNGSFFITCTEALPAQLKIMDINGRLVYSRAITDKTTGIETPNLEQGIYAVTLEGPGYIAKAVFAKQ